MAGGPLLLLCGPFPSGAAQQSPQSDWIGGFF